MADEVRRSGRATKGQHTKPLDEETEPSPAPAKRGKKAKAQVEQPATDEAEEDGGDIIRCVCGYSVENKKDKRAMICCDKCQAWQHNVCMGQPEDEDDLPEQYYCEICKPSDHKELLAAIKRGEKLWEKRQEEAEEEKRAKKKKGKGAKKGKATKPESEGEEETVSLKRKLEVANNDKPVAAEQGGAKLRKMSTVQDGKASGRKKATIGPQNELVERIEDLNNDIRRRAATALVKLFIDGTRQASEEGVWKVAPGQNIESSGLSLGLRVEFALYLNHWGDQKDPTPVYGEKLRMMLHNVKQNPELRNKLVKGSLNPNTFSQMSSQEMATKDALARDQELLREAEKQSTLIQEAGPRIRRTHKGEELVGGDAGIVSSESAFSNIPRRGSQDDTPTTKQADGEDEEVHSPKDLADHDTSMGNEDSSLTLDTQRASNLRKASSNFDIQNVWQSIGSPSTIKSPGVGNPVPATPITPVANANIKADADIDNLLRDDDDAEEAPYSPKEFDLESGMIWRGNVVMATIADFKASAKHVAGPDLSSQYPWQQLVSQMLSIEGRIDRVKASEYLCGLRWSKSIDVTVIGITPNDTPQDNAEFDKLFKYLIDRGRYGVVGNAPFPNIRDIYVVPLEAGNASKPEFIELLEESSIEDNRDSRVLLIVYVLKVASNGAVGTPVQSLNNGGSTLSATHRFNTPAAPSIQSLVSPVPPQSGQFAAPTGLPDGNNTPSKVLVGHEAAIQVLGELAHVPVVGQLLSTVPTAGVHEFRIIKECFEANPTSRVDLDLLMSMIAAKMQGNAT